MIANLLIRAIVNPSCWDGGGGYVPPKLHASWPKAIQALLLVESSGAVCSKHF